MTKVQSSHSGAHDSETDTEVKDSLDEVLPGQREFHGKELLWTNTQKLFRNCLQELYILVNISGLLRFVLEVSSKSLKYHLLCFDSLESLF